jgi:hypothetical protein
MLEPLSPGEKTLTEKIILIEKGGWNIKEMKNRKQKKIL